MQDTWLLTVTSGTPFGRSQTTFLRHSMFLVCILWANPAIRRHDYHGNKKDRRAHSRTSSRDKGKPNLGKPMPQSRTRPSADCFQYHARERRRSGDSCHTFMLSVGTFMEQIKSYDVDV